MKIAFIHFYTLRLPRGIETLVISLANELAELGHDVSILTARTPRSKTSVPISDSVSLKQFRVFRYYEHRTIQLQYARDLAQNAYDAVIVFFADFGEKALVGMDEATRPNIVAYWCYGYDEVPHRYQSYRRSGMESVTGLMLADSEYVAQGASRFFGNEVAVVPVGTDTLRYRPDPSIRKAKRDELGLTDEDFVLLNVAALERGKGAHLVVGALPEALRQHRQIQYLVLGEGSDREALEEQAAALGIADSVRFLGTTNGLLPYYNAGDCFILLSLAEANSVAMHEAMSCGLPVIVSDTGGAPEVVDSSCGILVNRNSRRSISEAIVTLASDPALRHSLGHNGRQTICSKLTWKHSASKLEEKLRQMLEARQGAGGA